MVGFAHLRKAAQSLILSERFKLTDPAGENLMDISLMTNLSVGDPVPVFLVPHHSSVSGMMGLLYYIDSYSNHL